MNLNETVKNIIPNPFSNKSTLSDLEKKIQLIQGGFNIQSIFTRLLGLLIIAFVLNSYFRIPILAIYILIGAEVVISLIKVYFTLKTIKTIKTVDTQDKGLSYRRILIISEYYSAIQSGIAFMASFVSTGFLLFFTYSKTLKLDNIIFLGDKINPLIIGCALLLFIVSRLLEFIIFFIRYNLTKEIPESIKFEQVNQDYSLIIKKVEIYKLSILISAILTISILLYSSNILYLPSNIILIIFAFILFGPFLMLFFSIIEYQRLKKVDFTFSGISQGEDNDSTVKNLNLKTKYPGEEILGYVFGINRAMAKFKDMFKKETRVSSFSFLGVGKSSCPENTILITNYRLLLVQLPLSGGDKVIGDINYVDRNFLFNRAEIVEKGEELLKTGSFEKMLELTKYDILYKDIKRFILTKYSIKIETLDGRSFAYFFLDKKYNELLSKILPQYLKGKYEIR